MKRGQVYVSTQLLREVLFPHAMVNIVGARMHFDGDVVIFHLDGPDIPENQSGDANLSVTVIEEQRHVKFSLE